jgi:multiple sugar transport system permease protein
MEAIKATYKTWADSPRTKNNLQKLGTSVKNFIMWVGIAIILLGVCYIILAPLFGIISRVFMSHADITNPLVFIIPQEPTLYNIQQAFVFMNFWRTTASTMAYSLGISVLQVLICSMVGYGFARFKFKGSELLFALVIISIVIPTQVYMIPMYIHFQLFYPINLVGTIWPMLMLTVTGVGIRSGLYIYIFRQFFRGIPKEIEEAAFIDGAGAFGTYTRIMLPNAVPAIVTVFLFAFVWQYNDTYYTGLLMLGNRMMANTLGSLQFNFTQAMTVENPVVTQLVVFGGVLLVITPIMIIYLFLQRFFVEGLERSGIVG